MRIKQNEFILYGLDNYKQVIDNVINDLDILNDCFDIKLLLTEALTNAFKHGNNSDNDKPIYLRYICNDINIQFEIEDCGNDFKSLSIPNELSYENLLSDCGRGLFLINCIADKIEFKGNRLVIQKYLSVI
ncbi:ATP-binding protein [Tepidibacter aestuarii]|uniref:ATP-binding protein n=1 Tax=Tepidibacter aestuarii TaxID=2925782 RepID=UPI0020C0F80F|nr:ATP-binding protein [Tepidibacter aestuarii]CAH2213058.1 serine/threonine-protein kinase RsbW [Tepidibacter aestuarii]